MNKAFEKDYYRFLGVERNASEDSILRAFRQKSREYHPDKVEGNEELMKLLTQIKVTLLDPNKKEKYDDTYEPDIDETEQDFSEKLYLHSGRKLSESYVKKINFWKNEIKFFDLKNNIEFIGEKWIELREKLANIPIYKYAKPVHKEYQDYLKENVKGVTLNTSLKQLIPENIWNLEVMPKSSEAFIKLELKTDPDWFFAIGEYDKALILLSESARNNEIMIKAKQLFKQNKFNECLLYCRYLMNVNKYCPEPTLMILKVLEKSNKDIHQQVVCAAKHYSEEEEIQKLMLEKLIEKSLLFEANNLLENDPILKTSLQSENKNLLKQLQDKFQDKIFETLKELVYNFNFKSMAEFIVTHPSSQTEINKLFTELTMGRKLHELPPNFRAMLSFLNGSALIFNKNFTKAFQFLREALFTYPVESTMDAIIIVLQSGEQTKDLIEEFMNKLKLEELEIPNIHQYVDGLKSSQMLRTIVRFERNIQNQKLTHFEKAMLYIDLCMACAHPMALANNLCLASVHLLNCIRDQLSDLPTVYALRNTICELCATALVFTEKYLDPIAITHFGRITFNVMSKAHNNLAEKVIKNNSSTTNIKNKTKDLIEENHKILFVLINQMLIKSVKVNPILSFDLTKSADLLYVSMVNHQFLEKYYNHMIMYHPKHPLNYLFKYYLFEGNWKNWFDQDTFTNSRFNCMKSLLDKNNLNINKMEDILLWPTIRRDKNGWINTKNLSLNLPGTNFTSVEGVTLDFERGTFHINFSQKPHCPSLICDSDVKEILQNGLSHSIFSLDQADLELGYFPFQIMRYSPDNLKNTSYLATVFHADYLLKMFAMETEICAKKPFEFQSDQDNFLNVLPDKLRKNLKLKESKDSNFGRAHRFWIEADELLYQEEKLENNKKRLTFKGCSMLIKEHLLKQDSDGEYVDDHDNDDDFCNSLFNISPEKKFAETFTENYDKIGKYFPIFLRLRELLKLSAILGILRNIYNTLEKTKSSVEIDLHKLKNVLRQIRKDVTYPINRESRVNELFRDTLRANGVYDESRVQFSEIMRVKREIRQSLVEAEQKLFDNVTRSLIDGLGITSMSNLQVYVRNWIVNGHESDLVNQLCRLLKDKEIEKLSRFGNYLKSKNVNLHKNETTSEMTNGQWVPAAFSMSDDRKCYGGVCLIPRLNDQNSNAPPPSSRGTYSSNTQHFIVRPSDLKTGQSTSANTRLRDEIKMKGLRNDDVSHILAKVLGGQMTAENAILMNKSLNRGEYRSYEYMAQKYLEANIGNKHARCELLTKQMYYNGSDRPYGVAFEMKFIDHGNKLVDHGTLSQIFPNKMVNGKRIVTNPIRGLWLNK